MEIEGRIIAVLPVKEGTSQKGNTWKSQDYVIETHDNYPKKCCFNVFGEEKIKNFDIKEGDELSVSFDIDAREYQGRWFNSIRAWKVERLNPGGTQAGGFGEPIGDDMPFPGPSTSDDLPFG
ncbi:MAG: DUF3127 domain-containing protein [Prevotella sp.]|nr:DUF3127 domain-containing protein [Prevotella sp.]